MEEKQCQICGEWYIQTEEDESIMSWCPECIKIIIVSSLLKRVEEKKKIVH